MKLLRQKGNIVTYAEVIIHSFFKNHLQGKYYSSGAIPERNRILNIQIISKAI